MKVKLLSTILFIFFNSLLYSQVTLDLKVNKSLLDVEIFGDSLYNVDVYIDYSGFVSADSISFELQNRNTSQIIKSEGVEFENNFMIQKIPSSSKAILRLGNLEIDEYLLLLKLFQGGTEIISDSIEFDY